MNPNIAIAELVCGVRYISKERSGWPRWSCSGQRRDEEKRERGEQREPVRRLDGRDVEDALERREDEGAGDEAGRERVEDDEDAPLELDLVRVHEPLDGVEKPFFHLPTSPTRRGRCRRASSPWPSAA